MSHWHLKFSMSKTNSSFPAVLDCQLALFLLICPQLMKQHDHPPSCLQQKSPWVPPFPPSPYPVHQQVLSISPPMWVSNWSIAHRGHWAPFSVSCPFRSHITSQFNQQASSFSLGPFPYILAHRVENISVEYLFTILKLFVKSPLIPACFRHNKVL